MTLAVIEVGWRALLLAVLLIGAAVVIYSVRVAERDRRRSSGALTPAEIADLQRRERAVVDSRRALRAELDDLAERGGRLLQRDAELDEREADLRRREGTS